MKSFGATEDTGVPKMWSISKFILFPNTFQTIPNLLRLVYWFKFEIQNKQLETENPSLL